MCEVLDVSPSGFYSWLVRPPSQRSRYDEVLVRQICRSFAESGESYGVRRVWPDVLAWGYGCGRERVARLMRQEKLQARPPRRRLPVTWGNVLSRPWRRTSWPGSLRRVGRMNVGSPT